MKIKDGFTNIDSCIICKSKNLKLIGEKIKSHNLERVTCQIYECLNCNHWFTNPLPKQELLDELYRENSNFVISDNWVENTKSNNNPEIIASDTHWIVNHLSKDLPGNYLEIGPGSGILFRKMSKLGWKCFAVDPGNYAQGLNIVNTHELLPLNVKFDVIVFQDVLEHVSSPSDTLTTYTKYLAKNAKLFITVPWSESKSARKQKINWNMVDPFGHLHYFSKSSAGILLKKTGFIIIESRTVNIYFQSYYKTLSVELLHAMTRFMRPWKWSKLKDTIKTLKFILQFFPGDSNGDQLYIMASKISK